MKQTVVVAVLAFIFVGAVAALIYSGFNLPSYGRFTQKVVQPSQTGAVKEFTIQGSSFSFNPSAISVNVGDTVKITFVNQGGSHQLCVDGKSCTDIIATGQSAVLQFVADHAGVLNFYCGVDAHRDLGMQGTITVV